jgi:hypothetical protein
VNGCFILGLDGHTTSIFEEVLAFARAVPLYDVQITVLTAFPGTPLYARLLAAGRRGFFTDVRRQMRRRRHDAA